MMALNPEQEQMVKSVTDLMASAKDALLKVADSCTKTPSLMHGLSKAVERLDESYMWFSVQVCGAMAQQNDVEPQAARAQAEGKLRIAEAPDA